MKNLAFFAFSILNLHVLSAQNAAPVGMQADFNQIAKYTGQRNGFESFQSFSSGRVDGSQFFYPNWTKGTVTSIKKEVMNSTDFLFLFDKVRQQLFIRHKDSDAILLADQNMLYSFSLETDVTHTFITASHFDPVKKGEFYEILVANDDAYTLLKQVKTSFVKADMHDIVKVKAGDNNDEFKDDIVYYISYKKEIPQKIERRERNIKKAFPDAKQKIINDYFEKHSDSEINDLFLTNLVKSINL